jgi:hypothetical protein
LEKGELQVSGKEREAQLSSQFRDIATIVMEKTINPETRRPYTMTMIERLMHEIHFAVDPNLTSKEQVASYSLDMLLFSVPLRFRLEDHDLHPSPALVSCCFRPKSYTLYSDLLIPVLSEYCLFSLIALCISPSYLEHT